MGEKWRRGITSVSEREEKKMQHCLWGRAVAMLGVPVLDLSSVGSTLAGWAAKGPCSTVALVSAELSRLP